MVLPPLSVSTRGGHLCLKKKLAGLVSAQRAVWPGPRLRPSSARLAPGNLPWLTLSGICEPGAEPCPPSSPACLDGRDGDTNPGAFYGFSHAILEGPQGSSRDSNFSFAPRVTGKCCFCRISGKTHPRTLTREANRRYIKVRRTPSMMCNHTAHQSKEKREPKREISLPF